MGLFLLKWFPVTASSHSLSSKLRVTWRESAVPALPHPTHLPPSLSFLLNPLNIRALRTLDIGFLVTLPWFLGFTFALPFVTASLVVEKTQAPPHPDHKPLVIQQSTHPSETPDQIHPVPHLGLHSASWAGAMSSEALVCNPGSNTNQDLVLLIHKMKDEVKRLHTPSREADKDYQFLWCQHHLGEQVTQFLPFMGTSQWSVSANSALTLGFWMTLPSFVKQWVGFGR